MKQANTPKRKRLNMNARLAQAKTWFHSYIGKNPVKGYAKWFGVDWICALQELKLAGISFTEEAEQRIIRSYQHRIEQKRAFKQRPSPNEAPQDECNNYFLFIVGYTSNGFPYGIRSEEQKDDDEGADYPWI